jgi:hypothetical protein
MSDLIEAGLDWRPERLADLRDALRGLGVPAAALDFRVPVEAPAADKPNGKARGKINGQGKADKERPPTSLLTALQPGEKLCRVRLVSGLTDWRRLVPVVEGYYLDVDRRGLFKDPARGGDDDDSEDGAKPKREQRHGFPVLLKCVAPRGKPGREEAAPSEVMCLIQWLWPNGDGSEAQLWSAAAIRKGDYIDQLTIAAVPAARPRLIQLFAEVIFAQRRAFAQRPDFPLGVTFERPVRHSGFSAADEAPAYVLHDGRALLPGGKTDPGSIAGEPPLLQRKRRDRWESRFQTLPSALPSEDQLRATVDALLTFDRKGRALCAAMLGVRALFYSLRSMDVTVLLTGLRGTAKTSIAQIMHWAEGPCAAADEPDMSFRTTFLGSELMSDRARDCAFLIDDGERVRANDPGAPLKPDIVKLISDRTREAFDGAPSKIRGGQKLMLAEQRRTQQLLTFSAETALGLEASVLARQIWWTFEKGEVEREPMLSADWLETPTWTACQETVTACGHAALRRALDIWGFKDRAAAVNFIREIDLEASQLAATVELGGEAEDRPRIQRGLAMMIAGGILFDIGAGTENLMRDLALEYGAGLARAQLDRLASGATATVGFDFEWFRAAFEDLTISGDYLWLDGGTGKFLGEAKDSRDASYLTGLGYQWRGGLDGFVPVARSRMGWLAGEDREYWAEPGPLFTYFERRQTRQGGTFPFSRQTLPGHLVKLGLVTPGRGEACHKPYIPMSDPRYPDKGSQPRVLRIPFESVNAENRVFEPGEPGEPGDAPVSHCNASKINLPACASDFSRPSESREKLQPQAGRQETEINQSVADLSPGLPALPAEKEPFHAFCAKTSEAIENVGNEPEIASLPASWGAELSASAAAPGEPGDAKPGEPGEAAQASQEPASAFPPADEATLAPEPASIVSKAPGLAAAASRGRWPERAAAIDAETLCLLQPDGGVERVALPEALKPEGVSLGELAAFAIERRITQLWLHPSLTAAAGAPARMTASEAKDGLECSFAAVAALPDGWRSGSTGKLKAWNRITDASQEIHVIASAFDAGWPFGAAKDAAGMLASIASFRGATGGFWPLVHPAVTTEKMLRALHRGGLDLSASIEPAAFPEPMRAEVTSQCWLRLPAGDERRPGKFALALDKSATYLAAMSSTAVGFGEPGYVAAPAFDARRAGYWRARVVMPPSWPKDFAPIGKVKGAWFVTPTLTFAAQHGARIEVDEAWLFPEAHRPFEPVYKRLRDARSKLMAESSEAAGLALDAVKSLYSKEVGNLASRNKRASEAPVDLYRPDWRHFIQATAQANILRNVAKAGLRPFGVRTDAIYLIADNPDPALAAPGLKFGREPGSWRLIGAMPIDRLPAVYLDGPLRSQPLLLDKLTTLLKRGGDAA